MRIIVLESLKHILFCRRAYSKLKNAFCDKLSRCQIAEAKAVANHLQELPVPIPPHLTPDSQLL